MRPKILSRFMSRNGLNSMSDNSYLQWLVNRKRERDEWLKSYRYQYNARRTSDEPSDEFFKVRSEQRAYQELIRRHVAESRKRRRRKQHFV